MLRDVYPYIHAEHHVVFGHDAVDVITKVVCGGVLLFGEGRDDVTISGATDADAKALFCAEAQSASHHFLTECAAGSGDGHAILIGVWQFGAAHDFARYHFQAYLPFIKLAVEAVLVAVVEHEVADLRRIITGHHFPEGELEAKCVAVYPLRILVLT